MTKKLSYTRLSKSRFIGLGHLDKEWLTAKQLGQKMWPDHRMATVNAAAIVRELLLADLVIRQRNSGPDDLYRTTEKAAVILKDPSWICRYCSLDTSDSNKRLWHFPCVGCDTHHQVCRFCRRHLTKVVGDFPYTVKLRGCPGSVEVPSRPEKKPREKSQKPKDGAPALVQGDLYCAKG